MRLALPTISSKLFTSRVRTAWAPQSRPMRRAVLAEGVSTSSGTAGPLARDPARGRAGHGEADDGRRPDDSDDVAGSPPRSQSLVVGSAGVSVKWTRAA
jgi:hypothetical protein